MEQIYSAGDVANMLNVHRDRVETARRSRVEGSPKATMKVGNRYMFTAQDVLAMYNWLHTRYHNVTRPQFDSLEVQSTS